MKKIILLLILATISGDAFAAISANAVWDVQQAGSNNNGCFFVTGASGTDGSKSTTPLATITTLSLVNATTTILNVSLTDYTVAATDVGNGFHNTGGTANVDWFEIVSVDTGTNSWTVDKSLGTVGETATGILGGTCGSLATIINTARANNKIYVKCDATYSVTTGYNGNAYQDAVLIQGYQTTQGDQACHPTLQIPAATSGVSILTFANSGSNAIVLDGFILDCNNQATSVGIAVGAGTGTKIYRDITVTDCDHTTVAAVALSNAIAVNLHITGKVGAGPGIASTASTCQDCAVYDPSSTTGHGWSGYGTCIRCVIEGHASATTSDLFNITGQTHIDGATAWNAGRDSFRLACTANCDPVVITNSVAYTSVGVCFNVSGGAGQQYILADYNGVGDCGAGYTNLTAGANNVTLTATPFTSSGTNDFSLNNTAGGGAALKNAGYPGVTSAIGTGYQSIGALQPAQAAGGGQRVYGGIQ